MTNLTPPAPTVPPPQRPQVSNGVALWLSQPALPTGNTLTINVNLAIGATATAPAAVQWALNYSASDFNTPTIEPSAVATGAQKTIQCNNSSAGVSKCLLYGLNATALSEGVVATITLPLAAGEAEASSSLQLVGGVAATPAGTSVPTSTYGLSATLH